MSRLSRVSEIDRDVTAMYAVPPDIFGPAFRDGMKLPESIAVADIDVIPDVVGSCSISFSTSEGPHYSLSVSVRCAATVEIPRAVFFAVRLSDRETILVGDPTASPPSPEISRGQDSSGATIIKISAILTEPPFAIEVV